jgi:hypothetical protein
MADIWDVAPCRLVDALEVLTASIFRAIMEAVSTSEELGYVYHTTRRNIAEDKYLQTRRLRSKTFIAYTLIRNTSHSKSTNFKCFNKVRFSKVPCRNMKLTTDTRCYIK